MQKYPTYKPSNIDWIGEIPSYWKKSKLKYLTPKSLGGIWGDEKKDDENDIICIRIADFQFENLTIKDNEDYTLRNIPLSDNDEKLLKKGDLLLEKSGGGEKTPVGRIVVYDGRFIKATSSNFINILKPNLKICDTKYITYLHSFFYFNGVNLQYIKQTTGIQNLDSNSYLNEITFLPPLQEQQAIVTYLDEKTTLIDELIAKKARKIELLKEQRISLINHVVTKGLDSNVPIKSTGVDWIGGIPEHWDLVKLKTKFKIVKIISGTLGFDVLSVTQRGLKIKDLNSNEGQHSMDYSKYQIVNKGQFVMNHMDLLTGFIDISEFNGVTSPDYRVFELINPLNCSQYYLYIFQLCYWNRIFYGLGSGVSNLGRWRLPSDEFKEFRIPLPPISEQQAIANFLDEQLALIDKNIELESQKIEKLKEYRQSLISNVVTGKIKVV